MLLECDDAPDVFHRIGGTKYSAIVAYLLYPTVVALVLPVLFLEAGGALLLTVVFLATLATFLVPNEDTWARSSALIGTASAAALVYELTRRCPLLL